MGTYESHGNISPFGDVMTCCDDGTVVRAVRRRHHDEWLAKIEGMVETIAELKQRVEELESPKPNAKLSAQAAKAREIEDAAE